MPCTKPRGGHEAARFHQSDWWRGGDVAAGCTGATTGKGSDYRGLSSYYRYGPRDVGALCNDSYHDVRASMRIHHSVFERIQSGATAYAPIGMPQNYEVVLRDGSIAPQGTPPSEMPAQAAQRFAQQQGVWNFVWWRRVFYFLTVVFKFSRLPRGIGQVCELSNIGSHLYSSRS